MAKSPQPYNFIIRDSAMSTAPRYVNGWWFHVHLSLPVLLARWLVVKDQNDTIKNESSPLLVSFPTARMPVIFSFFFFFREQKSVTTSCLRLSVGCLRIKRNSRKLGTAQKDRATCLIQAKVCPQSHVSW